jgi:beta-phosphoglucomutase family hydrolase
MNPDRADPALNLGADFAGAYHVRSHQRIGIVGHLPILRVEDIDAVIFDLDGVITKTASVHEAAWATLFNGYLQERVERTGEPFQAFESADYLEYVDGKPRYDGVASFLQSRGIELPWGSIDDPPEAETVCGLGNRKNRVFLQVIEDHGVEPYDTTVEFVHGLQQNGVATALISSSRNVTAVLDGAGLLDLFEVRIDGNVAAELGIPGKPDPAVFLTAASRVGVSAERAAIVEDAQSGVAAGRAGGFEMVIGVDRGDQAEELAAGGATVVVPDLGDFTIEPVAPTPRQDLPSAQEAYNEIVARIDGSDAALLLDYEVLPAMLSDEMRAVLAQLAKATTVAIVSELDAADVRNAIQIPGVYYAGSHGSELISPEGEVAVDRHRNQFEGDRGRAVYWLLGQLGSNRYEVTPIYLGDGPKDEDALRVIHKRGIGIVIGRNDAASHAHYALEDKEAVGLFLAQLAEVVT